MSNLDSIPTVFKWGKQTIQMDISPKDGVKFLKNELSEKTGVPSERMKLMAKTKGQCKNSFKTILL